MGELFLFVMSWKNFKYFFLFDPIGMTQQMAYYKEREHFSENCLIFTQSRKHTVSLQNLFKIFISHQRLVLIFNLLTVFKALKARSIKYHVYISFQADFFFFEIHKACLVQLESFWNHEIRIKNISILKYKCIFNLGMWD